LFIELIQSQTEDVTKAENENKDEKDEKNEKNENDEIENK
jgi:hypothetical protein